MPTRTIEIAITCRTAPVAEKLANELLELLEDADWETCGATLRTADRVEMRVRSPAIDDFIGQTAALIKDGECRACGGDGFNDNAKCKEHEPWDMPGDDAYETFHSLISQARELRRGGPK